jgi:hypothetical protein
MARLLEHGGCVAELDDPAQVHDGNARAHRAHHGEVVRDEDVGEREGFLKAPEELEHAGLHGHVEAGGRLVEDDHPRPQRQDPRQPDATLLAAAQLVRVEIQVRAGQADRGEDRAHLLLALNSGEPRVDLQRLVQRVNDLPARVERGAGVLVDVL